MARPVADAAANARLAGGDASSRLLCEPESLILLCVLPFASICGFLWIYTALPLHFVDSDWPLLQLSWLLTLIYVPRVVATMATSRIGDWMCVPMSALAASLNVYMLLYPSLAAVWLAVSATCASLNPPALRSLVYSHFAGSSKWQMQRALRIFTLSDTLGYACAPFVGGLLYDLGGLRACTWFAVCTCSVCTVTPLCLGVWRASFVKAWRCGSGGRSGSGDVVGGAVLPVVDGVKVAGVVMDGVKMDGAVVIDHTGTVAPMALIMMAVFSNIFTYGTILVSLTY